MVRVCMRLWALYNALSVLTAQVGVCMYVHDKLTSKQLSLQT